MQINRLFEMLYILLNRENVTAKELAERFEVSTRTIYRDLDTLSGAGIPVYTTKGAGGGIKLLERCTLNKSMLTEQEQNEVLMGLQTLKGTRYPEATQIIEKLGSLFNKVQANWIEVDFSHWGSYKEEKEKFSIIKEAILNQHYLEFEYLSSYGEKTLRKVAPAKLVFKGQAWYIQAYCEDKKAYRTFKITRIRNICCTKINFEKIFVDLPNIENEHTKLGETDWTHLKLHFESSVAFRVFDQFEEGEVRFLEDGGLEVEVSYPKGEWVYSYLLSFGNEVTVLEPIEVSEELCRRARSIVRKYSKDIEG